MHTASTLSSGLSDSFASLKWQWPPLPLSISAYLFYDDPLATCGRASGICQIYPITNTLPTSCNIASVAKNHAVLVVTPRATALIGMRTGAKVPVCDRAM